MSEPYIDCAIIGNGIFGAIIAKKLRKQGMQILTIDSNEKLAGSKPAACLMKPSWYAAMGPETYKPAMKLLEELYNVEKIEFQTKVKKVIVDWINPLSILIPADVNGRISEIYKFKDGWQIIRDCGNNSAYPVIRTKNIILAAGVWCNKILSNSGLPIVEDLKAQTGTSFKVLGQTLQPRIHIWMPYKQIVDFNISTTHVWVGDGIAVPEYTDEHLLKSQIRCANFLGTYVTDLIPTTGHRPYVKNAKPCYLKEHAHGLWVVTGGAKNGTIAAGWAAHTLGERLC